MPFYLSPAKIRADLDSSQMIGEGLTLMVTGHFAGHDSNYLP